jgi:glycosyltransferase involved in cell wall biosynthesis
MKLVVFAHTPPPHHGQSYMVAQMLAAFGPDAPQTRVDTPAEHLECFHINAQLSDDMEDVGRVRVGKLFRLLRYCFAAIACRFRTEAKVLYYVPAPGKRGALYRDWIVMALCRPFFDRLVLHWHAVGLGEWLDEEAQAWERGLTLLLLGRADVSIILAEANRADAARLEPKLIEVVPNGIPDPCLHFEQEVVPRRKARSAARSQLLKGQGSVPGKTTEDDPRIFRLLFLAHATREKGLFDALEAVAIANRRCAEQGLPVLVQLTVAGTFASAEERGDFERRCSQSEFQTVRFIAQNSALAGLEAVPVVRTLGFVAGEEKPRLFAMADAYCFPTYYHAESFGLVLIEAMAAGLPVIATRWRAIPELLPPDYPFIVEPREPAQIAERLLTLVRAEMDGRELRNRFLAHFTAEHHVRLLRAALLRADE